MPPILRLLRRALIVVFIGFGCFAAHAAARSFYVSASAGDDASDGTSPQTPWRSLDRVNRAKLSPGDTVHFQRGDTWRGTLIPQSGQAGAPVTYRAYGEGPRPLLLGSLSRNSPTDWQRERENIWVTAPLTFSELDPLNDLKRSRWNLHHEAGAQAKLTAASTVSPELQIACTTNGTARNHIQLFAGGLKVRDGDYFLFTFRARASQPFPLPGVSLSKSSAPYSSYGHAPVSVRHVTTEWAEYSVRFRCTTTADDGRITLFLGGALPAGATFVVQPLSWQRLKANTAEPLVIDVGNIIFDHGKSVGVKKWSPADLIRPGDYWHNPATAQVMLYATRNPAEVFQSIELALRRHVVDQSNRSHVTYEDLAIKYGAAHGFGGASTHHITIRQCDVAWIGGGLQLISPDGRPVRFGNGIEFWSNAHDNLVEACRIWEVYDAGVTNQGDNDNTQTNITYRDNVIWNCEFSFEFWNGKKSQKNSEQRSRSQHIRFENNTCLDAGYGWGHTQRPDPNGRHLMFYHNAAETADVVVCDNIFYRAIDSAVRFSNDWTAALTMDRNCWYQPSGPLVLFLKTPWSPAQFAEYQSRTKLDVHSLVADPQFVGAVARDVRLAPTSPALTLSATAGPVGARQRLRD